MARIYLPKKVMAFTGYFTRIELLCYWLWLDQRIVSFFGWSKLILEKLQNQRNQQRYFQVTTATAKRSKYFRIRCLNISIIHFLFFFLIFEPSQPFRRLMSNVLSYSNLSTTELIELKNSCFLLLKSAKFRMASRSIKFNFNN